MLKVTYETKHGNFTKIYEEFCHKIGDKVFEKSPYISRRGTYKVVKIEEIAQEEFKTMKTATERTIERTKRIMLKM